MAEIENEIKFDIADMKAKTNEFEAKFGALTTLDPGNKVGIDNKNEILAALTLSNFRNLAAVMAIPDLLTPGIKEKICRKPIINADLRSRFISRFFSFSILSEKYNKIPNNTVVHPIIFNDLKSFIIPDSAIK